METITILSSNNKSLNVEQLRFRASYYKYPGGFFRRQIRRLLYLHPRLPLYAVLTSLTTALLSPIFLWTYKASTMSKEDFAKYRKQYNADTYIRQKYGKGLWFPFMSNKNDPTGKHTTD